MSAISDPKRRGRPPGTVLPPEQRKSETIRVRVTQAQRAKFERLGGETRFRDWLDRTRES